MSQISPFRSLTLLVLPKGREALERAILDEKGEIRWSRLLELADATSSTVRAISTVRAMSTVSTGRIVSTVRIA